MIETSLKEYQAKRKFEITPEPAGKIKKSSKNRFVVHEHQATHLHYDFRLEMEGVLKSWAVPKEPPKKPGIKRLAVEVEDHPVDYINFRGTIPEGQYGAGRVKIWDRGTYKLTSRDSRSIKFFLDGRKLKGNYVLFKFKDKNWLLFKQQ